MDFIVDLPATKKGNNAILTATDRLTKERYFIACKAGNKGIGSEVTAYMLLNNVIKLHGLMEDLVLDRGTQFVSDVWACLLKILGVKRKLSTAYHPETDGQSENSNQVLEQYLRVYISYNQKD